MHDVQRNRNHAMPCHALDTVTPPGPASALTSPQPFRVSVDEWTDN
jgi:hypothetical protein